MAPSSKFEEQAMASGARLVAGIDEAGRGPLAGPVVAAAVVLADLSVIPGLDDSKVLSEKKRNILFDIIFARADSVGIGVIESQEIDRINILQATRVAMKNAVARLQAEPDFLLIDGPIKLDVSCKQLSIIKGDKQSMSIAAAGIVAKVTRDRIMDELDREFPDYGFSKHKGYGTKAHRKAIANHGPCRVHRQSFRLLPEAIQTSFLQTLKSSSRLQFLF